jgi:hypothetical protein
MWMVLACLPLWLGSDEIKKLRMRESWFVELKDAICIFRSHHLRVVFFNLERGVPFVLLRLCCVVL